MKVALISVSGKVLGWEAEPVRLILTPDGGAEQSPEEWWQAFLSAAGRLMKKNHGAECDRGLCIHAREGTVAVDKDGNALGNAILWMDMRGAANLKKQIGGLINIDGAGISNVLRFVRLTGGMPSMTGKDPAAHMLFIRDTMPEIYKKTYKFLNVLDYTNLRLTGEFVASFDSIVTSWVTDNRNPDDIHYNDSLIRSPSALTAKNSLMWCLAQKSSVIFALMLPTCWACHQSVKVVAGAIDNTAAAIGAGAVDDYLPHLYIGTSSWMAGACAFKKTDVASSMASIPCAVPGRYLLTALQATAGGNLTFLRDNIIYHKDELLAEADVPDIFKVLDQIANASLQARMESCTRPGSGVSVRQWMIKRFVPDFITCRLNPHGMISSVLFSRA